MPKRRTWSYLKGGLAVLLLMGSWYFLAPPQLGGGTGYVVTHGISMEPLLHEGDLVIVREAPTYGVGDVVAYRSELLGRTVLHRIKATRDRRFVMQGDNNDFLDPENPGREQIIGKMWIHIPKAGALLPRVRSPLGLAIGGALLLVLFGSLSVKRRRRRHRVVSSPVVWERAVETAADENEGDVGNSPVEELKHAPGIHRVLLGTTAFFGVALVLLIVVGVVGRTRSITRTTSSKVAYEQTGRFAYSADVPRGAVYQDGAVETGDPIFLPLVEKLKVSFTYRFATDVPHGLDGSVDLLVQLRDDGGWTHDFHLVTDRAFEGDDVTLRGALDLRKLRSVITRFQRATGIEGNVYTVTLLPKVEAAGIVAGAELEESFEPSFTLEIDGTELHVPMSAPSEEGLAKVVNTSSGGSVTASVSEPNRVHIVFFEVGVSELRDVSLVGGGIALLGLLIVWVFALRTRPKGEADRIQAKHGALLVPVTGVPKGTLDTIDVDDMDALASLAMQFEQPILHRNEGSAHTYLLYSEGLLYRYRILDEI